MTIEKDYRNEIRKGISKELKTILEEIDDRNTSLEENKTQSDGY